MEGQREVCLNQRGHLSKFDMCVFKCLFNILEKEKSLLFNYKHFFFLTVFQSEIDCHYNSILVGSDCEGRWQETLRPATHIL